MSFAGAFSGLAATYPGMMLGQQDIDAQTLRQYQLAGYDILGKALQSGLLQSEMPGATPLPPGPGVQSMPASGAPAGTDAATFVPPTGPQGPVGGPGTPVGAPGNVTGMGNLTAPGTIIPSGGFGGPPGVPATFSQRFAGDPSQPAAPPGTPPAAGPAAPGPGMSGPSGPGPGAPPGGPRMMPPQGMPQQPMDWRQMVSALVKANPGAKPGEIAAAMNLALPMLTASSQAEWRQISAYMRQQQLDMQGERTQQGWERLEGEGEKLRQRQYEFDRRRAGYDARTRLMEDRAYRDAEYRKANLMQHAEALQGKQRATAVAQIEKAIADKLKIAQTKINAAMAAGGMTKEQAKVLMEGVEADIAEDRARLKALGAGELPAAQPTSPATPPAAAPGGSPSQPGAAAPKVWNPATGQWDQ